MTENMAGAGSMRAGGTVAQDGANLEGKLVVCAAARTDNGRARDHNEDFVGLRVPDRGAQEAALGALLVVCDGVGGGVSGEVASRHAGARILSEYYGAGETVGQPDVIARLTRAIELANRQIFDENRDQPEGRRMTTTVVAAVIDGRTLHLAHTGDSRAYVMSGGQIAQVTRDHSWVAELVRSGDLTPEEAETHPWRNRITRALGMFESVQIEQRALELGEGDMILLCSDGLTRHVAEEEILERAQSCPPDVAAARLIDLANERGGLDNISVILAVLRGTGSGCETASIGEDQGG